MRTITRRSSAVAATTVGLIGLGIAFAAWTTDGEGQGQATAGEATPLTVKVTNVSGLYPTGTVTVPFTVTNTNEYAVSLSRASLKAITVDQQHAGCDPSVVTGEDVTVTDVVAAGATSVARSFPLTMSNAAVDACQGATFTVTLQVRGLSS